MKKLLFRLLYRVAPQWTTAIQSARSRRHSHRIVREWGVPALNDRLVAALGSHVQEGPFTGMALTPMTYSEHIGPFLLGVYESELDAAWRIILAGNYGQIIDVGAKFGYYAAGLARLYPAATVIAFDTDWWARRAVREMATANRLTNIEVRGFCDGRWLARNLREGAFLLSDCEGYEGVLFDGVPRHCLETVTLLIETHDAAAPGVTGRLRDLLRPTHELREYTEADARRTSGCNLDFLSDHERSQAQNEVRGEQLWLLALPKAGLTKSMRTVAGSASPG